MPTRLQKKEVTLDTGNITQWHENSGSSESYYGFFWGGMPDFYIDKPGGSQSTTRNRRYDHWRCSNKTPPRFTTIAKK